MSGILENGVRLTRINTRFSFKSTSVMLNLLERDMMASFGAVICSDWGPWWYWIWAKRERCWKGDNGLNGREQGWQSGGDLFYSFSKLSIYCKILCQPSSLSYLVREASTTEIVCLYCHTACWDVARIWSINSGGNGFTVRWCHQRLVWVPQYRPWIRKGPMLAYRSTCTSQRRNLY